MPSDSHPHLDRLFSHKDSEQVSLPEGLHVRILERTVPLASPQARTLFLPPWTLAAAAALALALGLGIALRAPTTPEPEFAFELPEVLNPALLSEAPSRIELQVQASYTQELEALQSDVERLGTYLLAMTDTGI